MFLAKDVAWCKFGLRWWILLSNVSGWPRVGHLCLIGYIGYGIFGRRTSERMRAIQSGGSAGCFTPCLTSCFTSRMSQLLPCFVCCGVLALVGAFFVLVLFPRGVVVDFFFVSVLAGT